MDREVHQIRDTFRVISDAITKNSTLTDLIRFTEFTGKIVINVEPNKYKIKNINFEYTYKNNE